MKERIQKNSLLKASIIFLVILTGQSCIGNSSFDKKELKFVKAYPKCDTAIYSSSKNQKDTIIFNAARIDTVRLRSIGQGFYNTNILRVSYKISKSSFHKFFVTSINKEPEDFIAFSKTKDSGSSKEISFLGLIFNEKYLDKLIAPDTSKIVVFAAAHAAYKGININKGIKNFVFDYDNGIKSFVDNDNVAWVRSK